MVGINKIETDKKQETRYKSSMKETLVSLKKITKTDQLLITLIKRWRKKYQRRSREGL